jgi:sec-independent protein translocase protein TatA
MSGFNPFSGEGLLVLVVILLLFGSKKLPDMARSLGRSARILKAETKGLRDDDTKPSALEERPSPIETDADREAREFAEWKAARAAGSAAGTPSGTPAERTETR